MSYSNHSRRSMTKDSNENRSMRITKLSSTLLGKYKSEEDGPFKGVACYCMLLLKYC